MESLKKCTSFGGEAVERKIEICGTEIDLNNLQSVYLNCDCMYGMKEFPDKYFDLAICDPEYGRKEHGGRNRSKYVKQKNGSKIFVRDGQYINRGWDNEPAGKEYFDELIRVSKHQIIWGCNYFDYPLAGGSDYLG